MLRLEGHPVWFGCVGCAGLVLLVWLGGFGLGRCSWFGLGRVELNWVGLVRCGLVRI